MHRIFDIATFAIGVPLVGWLLYRDPWGTAITIAALILVAFAKSTVGGRAW